MQSTDKGDVILQSLESRMGLSLSINGVCAMPLYAVAVFVVCDKLYSFSLCFIKFSQIYLCLQYSHSSPLCWLNVP